ncbi:MAG: carboxypeptidase-like regulatory domain-containing protein, partial [Bacteroidota bacterium]
MKKTTVILSTVILFCSIVLYSQKGNVSGILSDETGLALIGASILVKGTTNGTVTDIDGRYHIACQVGDVLVFSYTGYGTNEVVVTEGMFKNDLPSNVKTPTSPVKIQTSDAYAKALTQITKQVINVPNLDEANRIYSKQNYYYNWVDKIENIAVDTQKVAITIQKPDLFYEVGLKSNFGVQFARELNLPKLQNNFSQGQSRSGEAAFLGPDTDNLFSYGPLLSSLEFDGRNDPYDTFGRLVNQNTGNGTPANTYTNPLLEPSIQSSNYFHYKRVRKRQSISFNFFNALSKDLFNQAQRVNNKVGIHYENGNNWNSEWKLFANLQGINDQQPNINGFQNNLLFNLWATPVSFDNGQGTQLADGQQRRFNTAFNNPIWLLDFNQNAVTERQFTAGAQNEFNILENLNIKSQLNYTHRNQSQDFGLVMGTAGFEEG